LVPGEIASQEVEEEQAFQNEEVHPVEEKEDHPEEELQ
jgi:hypothetical protein